VRKNGWNGAVWDLARHAVSGKCRAAQFCNDQDADDYSRNEGTLDALIRPLPIPSSDAGTYSVHTASESSPDGEPITDGILSPKDPQNQPRQLSVGSPGVSVEQSGPRRSARLAGPIYPKPALLWQISYIQEYMQSCKLHSIGHLLREFSLFACVLYVH
jgi:hypothetical protein